MQALVDWVHLLSMASFLSVMSLLQFVIVVRESAGCCKSVSPDCGERRGTRAPSLLTDGVMS